MGNPMKIRAQAKDGITEIKVLMSHEMETGQRKDASGALVPAWFITEMSVKMNGKSVLDGQWGTSIAKNPFVAFKVKGGKPGDTVTVSWVDSKGDSRTDETTVS